MGTILFIWIIMLFAVTALFQWLWNITCPQIFNLPILTYWQAFRLIILAGILFGGFHFTNTGAPGMHSIHFGL